MSTKKKINFYSSWQTKLFNNEIKFKKKNISRKKDELAATSTSFRTVASSLKSCIHFIKQELSKHLASLKEIHQRKLSSIGINNEIAAWISHLSCLFLPQIRQIQTNSITAEDILKQCFLCASIENALQHHVAYCLHFQAYYPNSMHDIKY